ncbi:MAG: hypothetical protein E6R04_03195 [Spirochaetes bacterium]|nr:MAG: hypothetical protein E6R04_03195 [Spirochaetota bacterium]
MTATVSFLPVTLTVSFDADRELSDRGVGPMFTDEYRRLAGHPSHSQAGIRRTELERAHYVLASDLILAWLDVASRLAQQRRITLRIRRDKGAVNTPPSQHFRDEAAALISIDGSGDTWKVVTSDIPPVRS